MNALNKAAASGGFTWDKLGNIEQGREDLGMEMPVLVYRLMEYTMLDVLAEGLGLEKANEYFKRAGFLAGGEFAKNCLDLDLGFDAFLAGLQSKLKDFKIGILRMESYEEGSGKMTLTLGQDLDCSGIPVSDETVCHYDEGFLAGILGAYTGRNYEFKEVDCWASGDRICRFIGSAED